MQTEYSALSTKRFSTPLSGKIQERKLSPQNTMDRSTATSTKEFTIPLRRFSKKIISALVSTSCILGFFEFFTFGEAIYINDKKIAVVSSEEEYQKAVKHASSTAVNKETEKTEFPEITVLPAVTLKANISSAKDLSDKLLLSSGSFVSGGTLYVDGTSVFTCDNVSAAKKIVEKYISQYSMNGETSLSVEPTYKTEIIPKSKLLSEEECLNILSESDAIAVVSVVTSTQSKVIPFETKTVNDDTLYIGSTITETKGKNGTAEISHRTVYENGLCQLSLITSEEVTVQPVSQIVKVGTKYKEVLKDGLFYPLKGTLSSPFGSRWGRMHEGIDIAVSEGTPVKAAECGIVSYASEDAGGYGKFIKIDHGHGVETAYAHLSKINVKEGDTVSADTVIALSGNTGRSTGPHLHFEITKDGSPVDPLKHLK